jgi:hypothetical protein
MLEELSPSDSASIKSLRRWKISHSVGDLADSVQRLLHLGVDTRNISGCGLAARANFIETMLTLATSED